MSRISVSSPLPSGPRLMFTVSSTAGWTVTLGCGGRYEFGAKLLSLLYDVHADSMEAFLAHFAHTATAAFSGNEWTLSCGKSRGNWSVRLGPDDWAEFVGAMRDTLVGMAAQHPGGILPAPKGLVVRSQLNNLSMAGRVMRFTVEVRAPGGQEARNPMAVSTSPRFTVHDTPARGRKAAAHSAESDSD